VRNATLADQATAFCRHLGYHGIVDLDWRFDRRDGQYKLLDFNPRVGAQFRLFQNTDGTDVVRALHLDLTGRRVPPTDEVIGRRLIVENLDAAARLAYRSTATGSWASGPDRGGPTELAWSAPDDPLPTLNMTLRFGWMVAQRLARPVMASLRQHQASPGG
jgi:predicted ATP-grasp superfamily ATP-dependent carboligase